MDYYKRRLFTLTLLVALFACPALSESRRPAITPAEQQALDFLYAYMCQADKVDHDKAFYLANVRTSLKARQEMPWGKNVPDREWKHFVLPIRVNNEDLDSARMVFYRELAPRVKHLSMADAALEVNHWCHEHVTYAPSDARTSSPLASIRTARGRCGEESTLTVAAMRAVGIPARQVYTPRWAHTDDNHAWVEVWIDGKWHFLGACEPEPVLDLGWFNAPASRGMLMDTRVFGKYDGPEEVMWRTDKYTEINVTSNYAPTSKLNVAVKDEAGKPVEGAYVEFTLYNYAELHTVAAKQTGRDGRCSLSAGRGDMIVWATKNGRFGFCKASFGKDSLITIALSLDAAHLPQKGIDIDLAPPAEHPNIPEVTKAQRALNDKHFAYEDSIRNAYTSTFFTNATAATWAKRHDYDASVAPLLVASCGNHEAICTFLANAKDGEKDAAVRLLQQLTQKDLRDVTLTTLRDHLCYEEGLKAEKQGMTADDFDAYVRSPRIANELLTPFRSYLLKQFAAYAKKNGKTLDDYRKNPQLIIDFVKNNIKIDNAGNYGACPISPAGVWKGRVADTNSRNIFFVALTRSLGVPSCIDPVTGKVQLMEKEGAKDVLFGEKEPQAAKQGVVMADLTSESTVNPVYYTHFTLAKIDNQGQLQLQNYAEGDSDTGEGTTYNNLLKKGTAVDAGSYLMVSGTRLANGGVLARLQFFTVNANDTTRTHLVMRQSKDDIQVIGNFNSESLYTDAVSGSKKSVLSTTGRGYYVIAVLGVGQEPTNHALRDISALKQQFEKWGRKMLLLFTDKDQYNKYKQRDEFKSLPSTVSYGIDNDGAILSQIRQQMHLTASTLPVFIIADTFNRVVFVSQGYTIGLGEQMMRVINKL